MAKDTVIRSDLSGNVVETADVARVRIEHGDDRYTLDAGLSELGAFIEKATKSKAPGRKPKVNGNGNAAPAATPDAAPAPAEPKAAPAGKTK